MQTEYDYIIIGAGSAGSVLAYRLGEDLNTKILVIEAGPMDHNLFIHMPSGFAYPMANPRYTWMYQSEPEPGMDNRHVHCPRGKTIGGSSSINGMVYIRGNAQDYNGWADRHGLADWSYAHCLPYFKKAETREVGGDAYRGSEGPLHVHTGECKNPLYNAFIEAGQQAGYPYTADMNGYQQEGFGPMDMTTYKGRRWSTAMGYLRPALKRGNVMLQPNTLATRLLFEGKRAVGVEVEQNGKPVVFRARREVILSGGAINSPQLLQLSGIGNPDHLQPLGIQMVASLKGVGENLQDHLETYVQYECKQPITLYSATKPLKMAAIGAEWLLFGTGLGGTNHFESGGFIRSAAGVNGQQPRRRGQGQRHRPAFGVSELNGQGPAGDRLGVRLRRSWGCGLGGSSGRASCGARGDRLGRLRGRGHGGGSLGVRCGVGGHGSLPLNE